VVAAFAHVHFGRSFLFCALSNDKIRFGKTANARALARGHGVHALALPQDVLLVDGVRIALSFEATSFATAAADAAAATTTTATTTTAALLLSRKKEKKKRSMQQRRERTSKRERYSLGGAAASSDGGGTDDEENGRRVIGSVYSTAMEREDAKRRQMLYKRLDRLKQLPSQSQFAKTQIALVNKCLEMLMKVTVRTNEEEDELAKLLSSVKI